MGTHFNTKDDVRAWMKARGATGEASLRVKLSAGRFEGDDLALVRAVLLDLEAAKLGPLEAAKHEREERAVQAAEVQADAAQKALELSRWAIAISIVAALVSVVAILVAK